MDDQTQADQQEEAQSQLDESSDFDQESFDATQNLIYNLGEQLDEINDDLREYREMIKNVYENDETLQEAKQVADEAKQVMKERKNDLNNTQEVKELKAKMGDAKEERKMLQESLQNHLLNYYQMTGGSTTVDLPDGSERDYSLKAKLKRKKSWQ